MTRGSMRKDRNLQLLSIRDALIRKLIVSMGVVKRMTSKLPSTVNMVKQFMHQKLAVRKSYSYLPKRTTVKMVQSHPKVKEHQSRWQVVAISSIRIKKVLHQKASQKIQNSQTLKHSLYKIEGNRNDPRVQKKTRTIISNSRSHHLSLLCKI